MSVKYINPNTKKRAQLVDAYIYGTEYTSILQAYSKPSKAKINAWFNCTKMCKEYQGHGLYIISHTAQFFTAAFVYHDAKTSKSILVTMTGRNTYFCDFM